MISFIWNLLRSIFLVFIFLLTAPTLIFLTNWYYSHLITKKTYIGVLELPNKIVEGETIIDSAKHLFISPEIKGVIIKCNGIGGDQGSCLAIYSDLVKLKKLYKKVLISYIEREAFFGTYLIATAADVIVSSPGAIIWKAPSIDIINNKNPIERQYQSFIKILENPDYFKDPVEFVRGEEAKNIGLVNFTGGELEVEKVLKTHVVIEGVIQEIHGSISDHIIKQISSIISKLINSIKECTTLLTVLPH